MSYQPPFQTTVPILNPISILSGQLETLKQSAWLRSPQLRKQNRIRTIQGTLAIRGK